MTAETPDIDRLLNQARINLPGASDAALKLGLFDVFSEFFNMSSSWRENIDISIVPSTQDYDVVPAEGGTIIRLVGVQDSNKFPQPANMADFGTIHFRDPYNIAQTFTSQVVKNVVLPTNDNHIPEVPDWTLRVYGMTIMAGLLGYMYAQPAKTYTNETNAAYWMKKFQNGIAMARAAALRNNTFGTQAWSFPQTFRTNSQRPGMSGGV